ncbi:MAG: tRNA (adenosine(37)-N6)-threonylcarbamoyltransferase complex transferase subunit TsaD [Alphaproteobacteria bacterium]|nr:tRNA (adenosine(37)-N6)-threonylcarbamoyltransferase complex transferase subunit TsaD [Alphaproteobacteria bacterium]
MLVLGIETSCDETSAALVDDVGRVHAHLILSQLKDHAAFGGVVPELAARKHLEHLPTLIARTLSEAGKNFKDLSAVAATAGPGLIGGLLVGTMMGKAIAAAHDLPFIAINHLEGHALTPRLTHRISLPYLLLLVSGGHTQILCVKGVGDYERWGTTLDDAAGECFDKAAKLMGLAYPGGPQVEKMAAQCADIESARVRFPLPHPLQARKDFNFSFSGLKTAVRQHVEALPQGALKQADVADLCASLQATIADVMAQRCARAMDRFAIEFQTDSPVLVVAGGVAANKALRTRLEQEAAAKNFRLCAPPLNLCGDNAAMIAWAGVERLRLGLTDGLDFKARPRWPLHELKKRTE